ncbi:hypothetical protein RHMOL_Rhmol01G0220300 [Rhododendron molle]|uniref:Uncharacterized protein n=1 Tax=Rhododendron molle TaxID=49168 RepID=A0ACC0Q5H1_RHOML|nr:hypothetical protein RHMOL_Rhmol01G0220300 [Rhododendron molle]
MQKEIEELKVANQIKQGRQELQKNLGQIKWKVLFLCYCFCGYAAPVHFNGERK